MAERDAGRDASQNPGEGQRPNEQEREALDRREEESLRARLDRLSNALEAQKNAEARQSSAEPDGAAPAPGSLGSAMSLGFRVLGEFVAAIIVGALIGWQIDTWTGATPAFLLIFLLFGTAAGFWNVYRIAVGPQGSAGGSK